MRKIREAPRASGKRFASVQILDIIRDIQSSTENRACARVSDLGAMGRISAHIEASKIFSMQHAAHHGQDNENILPMLPILPCR